MKIESDWQAEWESLRAEREIARRKWRLAADGLMERAQDPLGLGRVVRDNPLASTGVGAVVGALLVKMFVAKRAAGTPGHAARNGAAHGPSLWSTVLRDAALSVAVPWLMRTLKDKFGWDLDPAVPPAPDRARAGDADPSAARP